MESTLANDLQNLNRLYVVYCEFLKYGNDDQIKNVVREYNVLFAKIPPNKRKGHYKLHWN